MADLGTIGEAYESELYTFNWTGQLAHYACSNPTQFIYIGEDNILSTPIALWSGVVTSSNTGTISGKTQVNGVDTGGIVVRIYYRPNGNLIGQTVSDPTTAVYSFTGLETGTPNYYLVALDPDTAPIYNLARHDRIVPA